MNRAALADIASRLAEARRIEAACFEALSTQLLSVDAEFVAHRTGAEMTLPEVAIRANVSLATVGRAMKAGELRATRFGKRSTRVSEEEYQQWRAR